MNKTISNFGIYDGKPVTRIVSGTPIAKTEKTVDLSSMFKGNRKTALYRDIMELSQN